MPSGEIPVNYKVICERMLVDQLRVGMTVKITAVMQVYQFKKLKVINVMNEHKYPFLVLLGINENLNTQLEAETDYYKMEQMSKDQNLF